MKAKKRSEGQIKALRLRAEKMLKSAPVSFQKISQKEIKDLVHDLQVYQIELEMQNEELRSSRQLIENLQNKYFKLYDLAPCGYLTMDEKGKIDEANIAAAQILGVNRKYLIKSLFPTFLAKDSWGIFNSRRERLIELGEKQECELKIRKKDGEFSFVWLICEAAYDEEEGRPRKINASMTDISVIKKTEEKLKYALDEWQNTFDSITDMVFILDKGHGIVKANKAFLDAFRIEPQDIVGKKCYEIVHKSTHPFPGCPCLKTFSDEKPHTVEILDSNLGAPLLVTSSPRFDSAGELSGAVHFAKDITKIKKAEEIVKRDKDALEGLVKEKTVELLETHKKLEMARRLSDIGQLASTVAHELRNPLGVIRAAAYNINRKSVNPDIAKHVNNIDKKISESDQIIQNLLGYAHLKAPIYEMAEIGRILDECIGDMRERHRNFDVQIEKKINFRKGFAIECDRVQITELFTNILDNAYKSLPDNRGRIEIAAGPDDIGEMFIISFKDDGVGVDKDDIEKIFDPFFSKRARGIGLGLTVCRQIAELHGGSIDIASELGKGAAVTVKLKVKHKPSLG